MKIQIENLRAKMKGVDLTIYQKGLALDEYYKLLDYVDELEQSHKHGIVLPALDKSEGGELLPADAKEQNVNDGCNHIYDRTRSDIMQCRFCGDKIW